MPSKRNLLALAMVAAAIVLAVWLVRRASSDPLRAVPASSMLVVSIDFEAFRASPLFKATFGEESARTLGFPAFADTCGFDPLARASQVHVAVPESGDRGDFGVVATGEVTADELVGCGQKLVGGAGASPPMRDVGSFKMIADEASGLRVAFRRGGPAIGGRGAWVETMMSAAEGREPSVPQGSSHARLREGLGQATVVLTATLPHALRDRLRKEWGTDESREGATAALAGVLAVDSIAIAIDAGVAGGRASVTARLSCQSSQACADVQKLMERKRFEWGKDLALRLVGVGALLDAVTFEPSGAELRVKADVSADELAHVVERVLKARRDRRAAPPASGRIPPPPLRPDEELKPLKDAGAPG